MDTNLCPHCGNELKADDKVCLNCGYVIINTTQNTVVSNDDNSVFSNNNNPVFVFNNDKPTKKSSGKVLILGIAIGMIVGGISSAAIMKSINSTSSSTYNKQQGNSTATDRQDTSKASTKKDVATTLPTTPATASNNLTEMAASGDPLITADDITVLDVSLTDYQSYKEIVFKLQNISDYDLSSLSLNLAELDSEGNIVGANAANLSVTCPAGKSFTIKCTVTNKDCASLKGSSFYYDCNNDHNVQEVLLNDEFIEGTTIVLQ